MGAIIAESFSILGQNFIRILFIGFILSAIQYLVSGLIIGFEAAMGLNPEATAQAFTNTGVISILFSYVLNFIVYGLLTAILIQLAYDSKLKREVSISNYIPRAITAAVPISVLSVVIGILMAIGLILLIVPGLWVFAVFYVTAAAITIERAGFGGMGRSAALTKGYRWPIVGLFVVFGIIVYGAVFIGVFIGGSLLGSIGVFGVLILISALSGLAGALLSISVALVYARLREIKEGVGVADIAAVFD